VQAVGWFGAAEVLAAISLAMMWQRSAKDVVPSDA
jgi:hypothetical protein